MARVTDSSATFAAATAAYPRHATSLPSLVSPRTRASAAKRPRASTSCAHVARLVPIAWIVRAKSSSSSTELESYRVGHATSARTSDPAAATSRAAESSSSAIPSAAANRARAWSAGFGLGGKGARSFRLPNAIE